LAVSILALSLVGTNAARALIVFDPNNYVQNVLTAARELQQINNQIASLQNEAQMLVNQAKNLASLPYSSLQQLQSSIQRTQQLLAQAQRIAYDVQQIDRAFTTSYGPATSSQSNVALIARTLSPRMAPMVGALVSCLGMVLLMVAVNFRDLVIYLLATAAAGGAYSLLFVGGLQVISMAAPECNRGGVLSALYLLGYLSMGALALVLGAIATTRGLGFAVDLGAAAIIMMNVATLVLAMITPSQVLGPPVVGEFDAIGKKVEEDTDPQGQEPTLPKIDSMQFVDVARIERLEDRDETIGGNIILDYERGQPNEADIIEGQRPQRIAIAGLDISGGRYRSLHALLGQRPALHRSGIAEVKTIMLRQLIRRLRNAVSRKIAR
jgi:hypothetical protein